MVLAAGPLAGYGIGYWLDGRFGTDPWGKVLLSLLGLAAGFKQVVEIIRRSSKEEGNS